MSRWTMTDEGGDHDLGDCADRAEAESEARVLTEAWLQEIADVKGTQWCDVRVWPDGDRADAEMVTVACYPREPACTERERHEWYQIEVNGHGGGVVCTDVCRRCGLRCVTDTWAQRSDTGEQGLWSIEYEHAGGEA